MAMRPQPEGSTDKGHAAVDPDSEIITATAVTPGDTGDDRVAEELIGDLLSDEADIREKKDDLEEPATEPDPPTGEAVIDTADAASSDRLRLYSDNSYGTDRMHEVLTDAKIDSRCKTRLATAPHGRFAKTCFAIDSVSKPSPVRRASQPRSGPRLEGVGLPLWQLLCTMPLRGQCTRSRSGRTVSVGLHEAALAQARETQADPAWIADYRATRPKVERKIAHLMQRKHGGQRARVRGRQKVAADFALLAGSVNLARLPRSASVGHPRGTSALALETGKSKRFRSSSDG